MLIVMFLPLLAEFQAAGRIADAKEDAEVVAETPHSFARNKRQLRDWSDPKNYLKYGDSGFLIPLTPAEIKTRQGFVADKGTKCRFTSIHETREGHFDDGKVRVLHVEGKNCGKQSPFAAICEGDIECTSDFGPFMLIEAYCKMDSTGHCPEAKACAFGSYFDQQRPLPSGGGDAPNTQILDQLERGGQGVPINE